MPASVRYHVCPAAPAAHRFHVTVSIDAPDPVQDLRLPAWIPGSYTIRDFARHLIDVRAEDVRGPVRLERVDSDTWRARGAQGVLTVSYAVYAWELTVRTAHLDRTHGFFNGTSLLLAAVGREDEPHALTLDPGPDPATASWRVATSLPRVDGAPWGWGTFEADSYDALVDHPVELGTFSLDTFDVAGVPHHLAVTGQHRGDLARLVRDVQAICAEHVAFFGGTPPMDGYLFLLTVVDDGYGGLEHRASTALIARRDDLPFDGMDAPTAGYSTLLGLFSHEYFHTWNVKRIKPAAFTPYDLSRRAHTTLLWAFEGITSYYDDLGVLRAGAIDTAAWLEGLGKTITRVRRAAGLAHQSLADSSFDAWTKLYKPDENTANVQISYYSKGSLAALALDLHLRRETDERVNLDDVMRALWARHGTGAGVPEDGVEALVAEVSGCDLSAFFDQLVRAPGDLPLEDLLAWAGLRLHARAATSPDDAGGKPGPDSPPATGAWLGARWRARDGLTTLDAVDPRGPACAAGLSAGDVLVSIDGLRATKGRVRTWLDRSHPGTPTEVLAFRRDELVRTEVTLGTRPADTWWVALDDADPAAAARRTRWLRPAR